MDEKKPHCCGWLRPGLGMKEATVVGGFFLGCGFYRAENTLKFWVLL